MIWSLQSRLHRHADGASRDIDRAGAVLAQLLAQVAAHEKGLFDARCGISALEWSRIWAPEQTGELTWMVLRS